MYFFFFFSSRRRHTRWPRDWSSDVCSSDLNFRRSTAVDLRKLLPGIKRELQRRYVRTKQYVRNDRARHKIRFLRLHAWIDVVSDVAVRPAVESSISQRREVIRRKIIPQLVAFIDRRPYLPGHRF